MVKLKSRQVRCQGRGRSAGRAQGQVRRAAVQVGAPHEEPGRKFIQ